MNKFNIGDTVWFAQRKAVKKKTTCPDCFGKKYLTVILGDDSKVTIDCAGCTSGFAPPRGDIDYSQQEVDVKQVKITRMDISAEKIKYYFDDGFYSKDVFATREEAEIRAKELAEEYNKQELERIHCKKKNYRTWAWHVHYYRDIISRAKKEIERTEAKLDVAKVKAKKQ